MKFYTVPTPQEEIQITAGPGFSSTKTEVIAYAIVHLIDEMKLLQNRIKQLEEKK